MLKDKKAKAEIETIALALKQFKSEYGDFPFASQSDTEEQRAKFCLCLYRVGSMETGMKLKRI